MHRILLLLALLAPACLTFAPVSASAQLATTEEAAALALFQSNLDAIAQHDAEAYLACYRQDDLLVRNGFGGVNLGYAELAEGTDPETFPDEFEATDVKVFWVAPGMVYGQYHYRVRFGDQKQEGISERFFLKGDDGWRIAVSTAFEAAPFEAVSAEKP